MFGALRCVAADYIGIIELRMGSFRVLFTEWPTSRFFIQWKGRNGHILIGAMCELYIFQSCHEVTLQELLEYRRRALG